MSSGRMEGTLTKKVKRDTRDGWKEKWRKQEAGSKQSWIYERAIRKGEGGGMLRRRVKKDTREE